MGGNVILSCQKEVRMNKWCYLSSCFIVPCIWPLFKYAQAVITFPFSLLLEFKTGQKLSYLPQAECKMVSVKLLCLFSCIKWEEGQDKQPIFTLTPYYTAAAASDCFLTLQGSVSLFSSSVWLMPSSLLATVIKWNEDLSEQSRGSCG